MSAKYEKLKTLLRELFQLDQPDLDFGIYRIMHARSAEIGKFLDEDLLPQVSASFAAYQPADKTALQKELEKVIASLRDAGVDPEQAPKVKELRAKLADEAVDIAALEGEVYDHLYSFFRRYYSEGDFISKRVYKEGVYAIPYEGEEVKLHWANSDQYYIKTSEYLRDYAFRLQPGNTSDQMRVHFRLVDAQEGEHGNIKEAESKARLFILAAGDYISEENGELVIKFEYRPATLQDWAITDRFDKKGKEETSPPSKEKIRYYAKERILSLTEQKYLRWLDKLARLAPIEKEATRTLLEKHIKQYSDRNTFDYFIHKDLGGFLKRELDFYVKNEVMHLEDVESESTPRVEQYLSKIKVIRKIAMKIIDFLAQIENFQKKLWLKKKFVVETNYCITLDRIPEEFYPEIAANDAQREEWVNLYSINEIVNEPGDLLRSAKPGYSVPLTTEFLKYNKKLMMDTKLYSSVFVNELTASLHDIDKITDGLLIHSENFQALNLLKSRYSEQIKHVYIDPPYNAKSSEIIYKNNYKHSSWMTMMDSRFHLCKYLLSDDFVFSIAIDENEQENLGKLLGSSMSNNFKALITIIHNHKGIQSSNFSNISEYCYFVFPYNNQKYIALKKRAGYSTANLNLRDKGNESLRSDAKTCFYPFLIKDGEIIGAGNVPEDTFHPSQQTINRPDGITEVWPVDIKGIERKWRYSVNSFTEIKEIIKAEPGKQGLEINIYKEMENYKTVWDDAAFNAGLHGTRVLNDILPNNPFSFPKSIYLVTECCRAGLNDNREGLVLDFFAGSGTTGHAVVNLNREDNGNRKFILVEIGDYFDTVLKPRIEKIIYSESWNDGKPTARESGISQCFKYIRLESYEDTLNNLELTRTREQQALLDLAESKGPDKLKEDYTLRYLLDIESRGSPSLLSIDRFVDPTAYKLKVKKPGSDESSEVNVDLIETFNYLIGLKVSHISAPHVLTADFVRDGEKRLNIAKGSLRPKADGTWWFRNVTGTLLDGRRVLVIWRKRPGGETPEGLEQDNLVLDEWFKSKQGYSTKDSEFDLIYVNGTNNLENLKTADDLWKVRLIEEDFFRLMFEDTEA